MARPLRLQARPPRALGEPHQPQQRRELHRPPASINLTAAAADSDGSIATVEFYNGATLIGTATTTPYAIAWTNIPIGNYSLTAKATDNLGLAATSAAVGVTVEVGDASTLYFIHPDHLNSPRLITDAAGTTVWRWDNAEPFGANAPIDDPDGDGKHLTFNLRYPGQYHDAESGLSYNYHRDYDPATGRYVESDPIGLAGGINTYAYVENDPLNKIDPYGLMGGGAGPNRKPNLGPFGPYCGPEGSILATWIPDLNVEACKKHDKCYDDCARRCEGKWCKYRCDVVLDQSIPFYGFATYFGGDEIYENLKKKYGCDKCDKKMMDD